MRNEFNLRLSRFKDCSDKAIDWFLKSRSLNGIDKEIAILYRKKNWKLAIKHLKLANKCLN